MTLDYTAAEYAVEIQRIKTARNNVVRDNELAKVEEAINALEEFVDLVDNPEIINRVEGRLNGFKFHRVSDVRAGVCKYKIVVKTQR